MKSVLITLLLVTGISLIFLGLIFFCIRAVRPKKWYDMESDPLGDTPEPESKPESNRIKL